jgi:hypothetical protein
MQPTQGVPFADPTAPAQPPQSAAPAAPDQAAPDQAQPGEDSNVSPEEQQIYDTVMAKAGDIIYGKGKVMPQIVDALKPAREPAKDPAAGNPAVLALANTATQIVSKLDASSKEAGQQIPDDVLYHAGSEIVGMLAEVAEAAGIHDYSEDEINGAFLQAVDNYRPIAEEMGRTDDATLKSQFNDILNADAHGQLGQLLPGLGDQPQTGQDQQQPQQDQPQQ